MNLQLFKDILDIDSTSGKERSLALWLHDHLEAPSKQLMEVGDGTLNLLFTWGTPKVVFCTHVDTVPPYIAPEANWDTLASLGMTDAVIPTERSEGENLISGRGARWPEDSGRGRNERSEWSPSEGYSIRNQIISGRGSCDAKGQLFAMYTACKQLEADGHSDFGLLLLAGEETGSWGAKAFSKTGFTAPFLIVGEPTDNKMVSAAKGTLSYDLKFTGEPFHSGYPQYGLSAIDLFNEFYNKLKAVDWGVDPELGETTWNIGLLHSDNPQNILSGELTCRLYFRTSFRSHEAVQKWMEEIPTHLSVTPRGGDIPARYVTLPGFESAPVAFGSDAPHLTGFGHKIICGPGSIKVAHRPEENIKIEDLETAVRIYTRLAVELSACKS